MSSEDFVDSVPQLQENDEVGSELTFFREKDMLIEMLKRVWYADNETFQRQFTIMDGLLLKYLEQPHLVCCHAEQLILPMNEKFLVILLSTEMCDDASKSAVSHSLQKVLISPFFCVRNNHRYLFKNCTARKIPRLRSWFRYIKFGFT